MCGHVCLDPPRATSIGLDVPTYDILSCCQELDEDVDEQLRDMVELVGPALFGVAVIDDTSSVFFGQLDQLGCCQLRTFKLFLELFICDSSKGNRPKS